jgi:hypothetical protein
MKSKGLGDTIAKITKRTWIQAAVEYGAKKIGKDCGCKERQAKVNEMFPYKDKNKKQ